MLNILRRTSPDARLARTLYESISAAARRPVFFRELAVDGRLHAYEAASDRATMADVIARNVYRGREGMERQAEILAGYAFLAREHLKLSDPANGTLDFGTPDTTSA